MAQLPNTDRIRLILYCPPDGSDPLCLDIPTSMPASFCLCPRKYLRYLGWCVLGIEGHVAKVSPGEAVDDIGDEGTLDGQGVYQYCYSSAEGNWFSINAYIVTLTFREGHPLRHAVDLCTITRSPTPEITDSSSSLVSLSQERFREILERRDECCIFSRHPTFVCAAAHIIPCILGDKVSTVPFDHITMSVNIPQWFQSLIRSRDPYDEDVTDLHSVDDVRNGFLTAKFMQHYFEKQFIAILKVVLSKPGSNFILY
jgi:hypothetical protein